MCTHIGTYNVCGTSHRMRERSEPSWMGRTQSNHTSLLCLFSRGVCVCTHMSSRASRTCISTHPTETDTHIEARA